MQTFMAHEDPYLSAEALDDKRLGKQRVECLQIAKALLEGSGWIHHPATQMWRGYEKALLAYTLAHCEVWTGRGHADTVARKMRDLYESHGHSEWVEWSWAELAESQDGLPWWWADLAMLLSHRSSLISKLPEHYQPMWPNLQGQLEYAWPGTDAAEGMHVSAPGKRRIAAGTKLDPMKEVEILHSSGTLTRALSVAARPEVEAPGTPGSATEPVADSLGRSATVYRCPECGVEYSEPLPATPFRVRVRCSGDAPAGSQYRSHEPAEMELT